MLPPALPLPSVCRVPTSRLGNSFLDTVAFALLLRSTLLNLAVMLTRVVVVVVMLTRVGVVAGLGLGVVVPAFKRRPDDKGTKTAVTWSASVWDLN